LDYFTESQHYYQTDKWTFSNNCFIDAPIPPQLPFGNNIQVVPLFIDSNDSTPNGFKLSNNSLLKDIGTPVTGIDFDYWYAGRDNTPSIGFHEYGGVQIITPIGNIVPSHYSLSQNYPNPFNPVTKIKFNVKAKGNSEKAKINLIIFDLLGKEVAKLVNGELSPGTYEVDFDASSLPSGVYFYKLVSGEFSDSKRMVLVK